MEFNYKFIRNEYGELECCYSCHCEVMLFEFKNPDYRKRLIQEKVLLCEICASTQVGSDINMGREIISPLAFAQTMNLILDKITGLKSK